MDFQKLLSLISKEEGLKLDFKEKLNIDTESGKKNLQRTYVQLPTQRVVEDI
ncbi:hypothetical protein [Caloramator sp. Dgby_cultured_2]|uniref:hypothetical protein n=1 Tax=Caloramator sp. Dgby_cultured_2 TaxID=3029174 RepID=UPI00237E758B|nr:hypothetical protein [Caloramator sp. Dgby_cultured_2]WDU83741.1 hypothetical protein PWK10_04055 [Caloramator sp. Dgby_cultured_2]